MKHSSIHLFPALFGAALLFGGVIRTLHAQPLGPQEIPQFLQTLVPQSNTGAPAAVAQPAEAPRISMTADGYLRYVGAPPGQHFPPAAGAAAVPPEIRSRDFLLRHGRLFGLQTPATDFRVKRNRQSRGRSYVRMQQLHRNIPIVAAEVVVQVDDQGGVECVLGDLAAEAQMLGTNTIPVVPALSANEAAVRARAAFATVAAPANIQTSVPQLAIFAPSVLDESGSPTLVWDLEVTCESALTANARVLVNALNGDVVRVWSTVYSALNREIYDANSTTNDPGTLTRTEGQPASGIADVNNAYDYLGDTYAFYFNVHGRDSLDGNGLKLSGTVRYCSPNGTNAPSCPPASLAFFSNGNKRMYFGAGYTADDVTAHELTHGVTLFESGLIYTNASGAINESFSDVWGEFVDLGNGRGTDTPAVRWLIGEDIPGGAIRSMTNPPAFFDPDRLFSPLYQQPSNTNDFGGVHKNSGVNNKLCYLLTDGNTFNGQTVYGMGVGTVASLYYEVQVNLLTSGEGWAGLYNALRQAAVNLGWNTADRNNLYHACLAVEFVGPSDGQNVYVDKTSVCPIPAGLPTCNLNYGPYVTIGQGVSGANPGDILRVQNGNYNEPMTVDKALTIQAVNGPVTIGP